MTRLAGAVLCCALACGCATIPTEAVDHVSLAAVEERVKCEIGEAFRILSDKDHIGYPDLGRWAAGLTLALSVDSTGGVVASTSLTGPFGSVSPLDLSAGASLNAKRTALLNVYIAFIDAANHQCPPASPILLEGHLGLGQWIVRVFEAQHAVDQKASLLSGFVTKDEKSIGYTMEFLVTLNASATPNFIVSSATGTKAAFAAEAKSTHSVDIAMVEMSPSDFRQRFHWVRRPVKQASEADRAPDAKISSAQEKSAKKGDQGQLEKRVVGVETRLGPETKGKLDFVLQQLNNKLLIQSLRR